MFQHVLAPQRRAIAMVAALLVVLAACGGGGDRSTPTRPATGSPTGSPSSPTTDTPPAGATVTPAAIGTPFSAPWPVGWDAAFCATFADLVVVQELAVDIGRALGEDARDDARALAGELAGTAADVRTQLAELPPWEAAAPLEGQIVALLDLADRMANRYEHHFRTNRRNPLNAARRAGGDMNDVVPELLDRLIALEDRGLSCRDVDFDLETPPRP